MLNFIITLTQVILDKYNELIQSQVTQEFHRQTVFVDVIEVQVENPFSFILTLKV